ncbi:MAG: hypothetical protein HKN11_12810 [Rhizobiales bacterium]|nr:hypothetical protein [Hyphomicrobiales bacterium]
MQLLIAGSMIFISLLWTHATAKAACITDGKEYPEGWALEQPGGLVLMCKGATWTMKEPSVPYEIKSAELKNLDDPSQRPRCNAKELIKSICGPLKFCKFEAHANLCANPDIAGITTHIDIVWRCRADTNWHFQRIERGRNIVFDCQE